MAHIELRRRELSEFAKPLLAARTAGVDDLDLTLRPARPDFQVGSAFSNYSQLTRQVL